MTRRSPILFAVLVCAAFAPASTAAGQIMDWSAPLQLDSGSPSHFDKGSGIDCVGEQLCVATGGEGRALVSTDPTGGSAAWEEVAIEEASAGDLTAASCPSASFCAAVDDAGNLFTSAEPDGGASAWSAAAIDPGHELVDVSCPSASFCAAIDDAGNALVSDEPAGGAAAWESAQVLESGELKAISCASVSLCVLAYDGSNVFYEPPGLLVSTDPLAGAGSWADAGLELGEERGQAFGISCPSDDFCGFAYSGGIFVSSDPAGGGSAWHLTHASSEGLPPGTNAAYLEGLGITCSSADFCVAQLTMAARQSFALPELKLVISSQPATAGSWTVETMNREWDFGFAGISCTGPGFCATVSEWGQVSTSTEPAGGSEAWDLAVAEPRWPTLTSVACPAQTFCAATGTQGRLYTSTDPTDPGSWTATRLAEAVEAVTCSSPSWCAVGADGPAGHAVMYATEPAAGAGAWSAVARPTGRDLTCPEPGFCAELTGNDEVLASDDPLGGIDSWVKTDMQVPEERLGPGFLSALSCPSAGLCVTGGSDATVYATTNPTGGRSGWVSAYVGESNPNGHGGGRIEGIDCPQTSFCAVTDGAVATTTAPLGGKEAWTRSSTSGTYILGPISCAADASLCVTIDQHGNAVTSSSPQDEVSDWGTLEPIYEGEGLRNVSCAVDGSLCAVISSDGEAIVGTRHPEEPQEGGGDRGSSSAASPSEPRPAPAPHPCRKPQRHKAKRGPAIAPHHKVSSGGKRSKSRCARPR